MNRGEAAGFAAIMGVITIAAFWIIVYYFIFDNLFTIALHLGYDLIPVEEEVWWLCFGVMMLLAMRTITKAHKWARRNYCNHCGLEVK